MIKTIIVVLCGVSILLLLIGSLLYAAKKSPYVYALEHLEEYGERDLIYELKQRYGLAEDEAYDLVQEVKRDLNDR